MDEGDEPTGIAVPVSELPKPDLYLQEGIRDKHPAFEDASGGYFGALKRTLSGVPPYVWVENYDDEPITVVVSKFKASHSTNTGPKDIFFHPATTKQIPARETAAFPLWTRKSGYGVITIYKGVGEARVLFIENDRVEAGYLARFRNSPNLKFYDYRGRPVKQQRTDILYGNVQQ